MLKKIIPQEASLGNLVKKRYENGQLAIYIHNEKGEQLTELSIKDDRVDLNEDEIILKDYSENSYIIDGMVNKEKLIPTDRYILVGNHLCPICRVSV